MVPPLFYGNVVVFYIGEPGFHGGKLVVVGGEQGLGPQLPGIGGEFQHGPGDAHAVIGGGASADLVQDQQTAGGGVFQNGGHLGHFHHKGGLAGGQIVAGADPGKHPVYNADPGSPGGDEGAHLGHEDDEGHLAHIGGFTGHVGAGDDGNLVVPAPQTGVVGDKETVPQHGLHHRMAAIGDGDFRSQADLRAAVATLNGHVGQRAEGIRGGHGSGGLLHGGGLTGKVLPELLEDLVFQGCQPVFGGENLGFQVFQLLGDVALAVGQGLLADVGGGHLVHKGFADFDIIAEDPVKAHLQGADAGFFPLTGLNGGNGAGAAIHDVPEPVSIRVRPPADHTPLPDGQRGLIDNGVFDPVRPAFHGVDVLGKTLEHAALRLLQLPLHLGQGPQAPGQGQKVPAIDGSGDDAGHDPLQIRDLFQSLLQFAPENGIFYKGLHGLLAACNLCRVQQGLFQPAPEHPAAHGGVGLVQDPQQSPPLFLGAHGLRQLQVPPGIQIQLHEAAVGVVLQLPDMGQVVLLQGQQSLQQGPAGADGPGKGAHAQILDRFSKVLVEQLFTLRQLEVPGGALVYAAVQPAEENVGNFLLLSALSEAKNLAGGKPAQLRADAAGIHTGCGEKSAGRQVAEGQAVPAALGADAAHEVILGLFQHAAFRHRAGGDDSGDVPLYQALGRGGILHLLADGDLVALLHQSGDIGVYAVVGYAAHGGLLLFGLRPVPAG